MVEITRVLCLISPFNESIKLLRVIIPHYHSEIIQIIMFISVNARSIFERSDNYRWGWQNNQTGCFTWPERHFDSNQGIVAVCEEILCFFGVDPDHSNEKMTRRPQTDFHLQRSQTHSKRLWFSHSVVFGCMSVFITFGEMMSLMVVSRLHSNTWAFVSFLSQCAANQILAKAPRLDVKSCV